MTKAQYALRLLESSTDMSDSDKLASDIEQAVKKHFPDSYIKSKYSNNLGPMITISFTLGKDKDEWANGIINNDPVKTALFVNGMNRDGSISGSLELTKHHGDVMVKSKDRNMAFDRVKVPFRKTTGDPKAIVKAVDTYFSRLKKILQDNRDNLRDEDLKRVGNKF